MNLLEILIGLIIIMVVLGIYYAFKAWVERGTSKKEPIVCNVDIDELIDALGGEDNISEVDHSHSKLIVELVDNTKMNPDKLRDLGASGVVEGSKNISMIFGRASEVLDEQLHDQVDLL